MLFRSRFPVTLCPPDYSDAGNAVVFAKVLRDTLVYVDALGWLWWDGRRWERNEHKATACAMDFSERMLREGEETSRKAQVTQAKLLMEAAKNTESVSEWALKGAENALKDAKAFYRHAQRLRSARQLNNMTELSKPYLLLKADCLDANPFDLNTPAGIVDLTTGTLRPHDRKAYCSRITNAVPGEKGAETWEKFLDTVTCGDGSVQGFLQMVAGMALIGAVYQEGILIAYGGGRNGKSTFFNALGEVLGDYSGSMDVRTLTTEKANRGASLATLRGKRLVITGELEEHQRLSEIGRASCRERV